MSGRGRVMSDFDNLYADEFQCPYCENTYKFSRNRNKDTVESAFHYSRYLLVKKHVETYHPDKVSEFPKQ